MHTEIRLKQLLDQAGDPTHGRIERIARATGLNRHTVRKFLKNEAMVFSLDTVSKICDYLAELPGLDHGLPGKLFAARPSQLMHAMLSQRQVTFYLGESKDRRRVGFARAWVSRDDYAVAAQLVERLSQPREDGDIEQVGAPAISYVHIPSRWENPSMIGPDQKAAKRIFRRMRNDRRHDMAVLIGSQRANYVVECFLGDLFHAEPFTSGSNQVPIYLKYHEPTGVASCFGGDQPPPEAGADQGPGIYYRRTAESDWEFFPSTRGKKGTGVVIARRDPGLSRLELTVFGLSGIATAAMGKLLLKMPERFWPKPRVQKGLEIGVYACGFDLLNMKRPDQDIDDVVLGSPMIVDLQVDAPYRRAA